MDGTTVGMMMMMRMRMRMGMRTMLMLRMIVLRRMMKRIIVLMLRKRRWRLMMLTMMRSRGGNDDVENDHVEGEDCNDVEDNDVEEGDRSHDRDHPGPTFCASLPMRKHVTETISCRNLQANKTDIKRKRNSRRTFCASLCSRNAQGHVTRTN